MTSQDHAHQSEEEMKKHGDVLERALNESGADTNTGESAGTAGDLPLELPTDVTPRNSSSEADS